MPIKALLTNRELHNKVTGIDLYVSDYQEIPHRLKNTFLYHVIVVTNLFYYKLKEHRESDVVQFMVSKTYEEFEELYNKLYTRFPSVNFPSLPSRSILTSNTKEKLKCMDEVLKLVASTQKLCCSPMLISFLKSDADTKDSSLPSTSQQEKMAPKKVLVVEPNKEEEDEDLFGVNNEQEDETEKDDFSNNQIEKNITSEKSIFFADPEESVQDDLFTPASNTASNVSSYHEIFDEDDLLDIKDDFDDLLALSKSSEKQQIKIHKPKPTVRQRSTDINDDVKSHDDIFRPGRSHSIKKERSDSSVIHDVFEKKQPSFFDNDDDDNYLFSGNTQKDVKEMGHDDIASYLLQQENTS